MFKVTKVQDKTGKSLEELLKMDKTEFKKSLDQMEMCEIGLST